MAERWYMIPGSSDGPPYAVQKDMGPPGEDDHVVADGILTGEDAALIAALPGLLASLKELLPHAARDVMRLKGGMAEGRGRTLDEMIERARANVARAEGK